jgi:hypothetical protein
MPRAHARSSVYPFGNSTIIATMDKTGSKPHMVRSSKAVRHACSHVGVYNHLTSGLITEMLSY